MLIHEAPEGEDRETRCCGTLPPLLPSGDLVTGHAGIVTCDRRVPRCPDCNGEAGYIWLTAEPPVHSTGEPVTVMKVDPCAHEFTVRVGIQDSRIRLEKRG